MMHVEFLRFGTKIPMVLPQRITKDFVKMLKKHHPLFLSIHVTHPREFTPETTEALNRLADAGIPLGQPDRGDEGHQRRHRHHEAP